MIGSLLLALALSTEPSRQLNTEVSAGAGVGGTGYTFAGGRWGDGIAMPFAIGRVLLGPAVGELELLVAMPLSGNRSTNYIGVIPRLGWSGQTWSVLVGATLQIAPGTPSAVQVLPSLRVRKDFAEKVGVSLGLFDLHGLAPFHLSAELYDFDLGYVAPLGISAGARFSLPWAGLVLQVRGLAFRLFNAEVGLVTLSLGWENRT